MPKPSHYFDLIPTPANPTSTKSWYSHLDFTNYLPEIDWTIAGYAAGAFVLASLTYSIYIGAIEPVGLAKKLGSMISVYFLGSASGSARDDDDDSGSAANQGVEMFNMNKTDHSRPFSNLRYRDNEEPIILENNASSSVPRDFRAEPGKARDIQIISNSDPYDNMSDEDREDIDHYFPKPENAQAKVDALKAAAAGLSDNSPWANSDTESDGSLTPRQGSSNSTPLPRPEAILYSSAIKLGKKVIGTSNYYGPLNNE